MMFWSDSVLKTYKVAGVVAEFLQGGEAVLLNGGLGAGKTTFTKGLAAALGFTGSVVSPTFTIIKEYNGGRLKIYHADLYRIKDADEAAYLGLEECFTGDSVAVIEWNKFAALPKQVVTVDIEILSETERAFRIKGIRK